MKTKIDEIYRDIKGRIKSNPDLFKNSPEENIKILADIVQTVNLAKCNLFDLDSADRCCEHDLRIFARGFEQEGNQGHVRPIRASGAH